MYRSLSNDFLKKNWLNSGYQKSKKALDFRTYRKDNDGTLFGGLKCEKEKHVQLIPTYL
jgi:hypothetical protein